MWKTRQRTLSVALGVFLLVELGQGHEPASHPPSSTGSTLTQLAAELGRLELARPSLVAVTPIGTDSHPNEEPADLSVLGGKVLQVLGAQVPGLRQRLPYPQEASAARRRARQLNLALVLLQPALRDGKLLVTVDVVEWPKNFWERSRLPEGTTIEHITISKAADTEIRRYLPRPPALLSRKQIFSGPAADVLALACGELGPDARQRLLVVGRRRLFVGRFSGDRFLAEAEADWAALSPLSANPLRAPLAGAVIHARTLHVGSSDRRDFLSLSPELEPLARGASAYPTLDEEGRLGCHAFSQTGLSKIARPCPQTGTQTSAETPRKREESVDALAAASLADREGATSSFALSVSGRSAELEIRRPAAELQRQIFTGIGAEVTLADLDGDLTMEVVHSRATLNPTEDAVVAQRIGLAETELLAEVPTGPVSAITVCPFSGSNPLTVIAAVAEELWVLR